MMKSFFEKNRWFLLFAVLLSLFIWKLPLETQDGPNHKKVAVILARLETSPSENHIYKSNLTPFHTNQIFPLLYKPLSHHLSPNTYEKIFFGFFLFLLVLSFRVFLAEWSPENGTLWVLILPFLFHPLFIMGMYNFLASVPLTLFALTFLRKGLRTKRPLFFVAYGLSLYIAFLAHPFPFFIVSIILLLLALGEFREKLFLLSVYSVPNLFFLFLGFVFPLFHRSADEIHTPYFFKPVPALLADLFAYNFTGYSIAHFLFYVPFFLSLLGLMVYSLLRVPWRNKIFWVSLFFCYLLFPNEGNGGAHLNLRFLPYIFFFLPIGLSLPALRVRQFQILILMTALIMVAVNYHGMRNIRAVVQDAREVFKALPQEARLYSINFDPDGPAVHHASLMHLWTAYDDSKVIFSPYLFAHMDLMPLSRFHGSSPTYFPATSENLPESIAKNEICTPKNDLEPFDCPTLRLEAFQKIFRQAAFYDYWFVYEPPPEFLTFLQSIPGLKKISEQKKASLWAYEKAQPFTPSL